MKQAIIYARFSPRPNPERCTSIEFQIEKCRAYCQAKDFDVVATYQDENISGKRADNRPGFQEALVHVCKVQGVLVGYDLFRVTRGILDAVKICQTLEKHGADLALATQAIDTTTAMGRFIFKLMAAMGELEREIIAERTASKLRWKKSNGQRISCHPCYGERLNAKNNKLIEVNPDEMVIVRQILVWRSQGDTFRQIVAKCISRGYQCRGREWHHETIRRVVTRYKQ